MSPTRTTGENVTGRPNVMNSGSRGCIEAQPVATRSIAKQRSLVMASVGLNELAQLMVPTEETRMIRITKTHEELQYPCVFVQIRVIRAPNCWSRGWRYA